jgi:hypothetical protein
MGRSKHGVVESSCRRTLSSLQVRNTWFNGSSHFALEKRGYRSFRNAGSSTWIEGIGFVFLIPHSTAVRSENTVLLCFSGSDRCTAHASYEGKEPKK